MSDKSFIKNYLFSTDHKTIAKQFLIFALLWIGLGGFMSLVMRWQLAYPETPLPVIGASQEFLDSGEPQGFVDRTWQSFEEDEEEGWWMTNMPYGIVDPSFYNVLFTMHATIMVFFVAMPLLLGTFANFLIPLMIGARDMAFPFLNMLSFWATVVSGFIMIASFLVPGGASSAGWTAYPPLSAVVEYTGVNWGINLWILSLGVFAVASMMGSINYITTVINLRAKGLSLYRLPIVIWFIWITSMISLLAFPVLLVGAVLLLFDRTFGTAFYAATGGGDPLLWQHLFWFFGHPEVYILFLPAFGITLEILPVFSRKTIFSYKYTIYALITASVLSFVVWGHHMFVSGMDPGAASTFFGLFTILISAPFALIMFNTIATLYGGKMSFTAPMHYALGVIGVFIFGGLGGIYLGSSMVNMPLHDTYFVVGHFHFIIFGAIFLGICAGIQYWFPKMFGRMMNETLGKLHFWLTITSFIAVFFPMHLLGMAGHIRRIYNPMSYEYLQDLQWINVFISWASVVLFLAQFIWLYNFVHSYFKGKIAEDNPWKANSIEWTAHNPVPHGNCTTPPVVYRGAYESSVPGAPEDWIPQTNKD